MDMQPIYFLLFLLASTRGLPVRYDQRQDGDLNVHAHLENFVIVFIPGSSSSALSLLDVIPLKKEVTRFQIPGTGTKLSAPDFPAAKSPYKVDLDTSVGKISKVTTPGTTIEITQELMIGHIIKNPIEKTENEAVESTTEATTDEDATQNSEDEPAATEKVEKDEPNNDSERKENAVINNTEEKRIGDGNKDNALETGEMKDDEKNNKGEKTEDEVNTEDKKEGEKPDDIPVIDSAPGKPMKSSKSIDFGLEIAGPTLQKVNGDGHSSSGKSAKVPNYRHEFIGFPDFEQLKKLTSGISGCQPGQTLKDDGQCEPVKSRQRTRSFFPSVEQLLPILQFGLSPADSD